MLGIALPSSHVPQVILWEGLFNCTPSGYWQTLIALTNQQPSISLIFFHDLFSPSQAFRCPRLKSALVWHSCVTFPQTAVKQSSCKKWKQLNGETELWDASPGASSPTPLPTQELHLNAERWLPGLAWHLPHCYRLAWQCGLLPNSVTITGPALMFLFEQWGTVYRVGEVTALPAVLSPLMPGLPSHMEQGRLEMWDHQAVFILELRKY